MSLSSSPSDPTLDLFASAYLPPEKREEGTDQVMVNAFNSALASPDGGVSLRTLPAENGTPEVILNLWYIFDDSGICYALRAKAYVAAGTDAEKLTLLHTLSINDWRIAPVYPIPESFFITGPNGEKMRAFNLALKDVIGGLITLFEPAIREIENKFPKDCELRILQDPLICTTPLYLHDDGTMEVRPQDVENIVSL